ncbi:MAG: RDD family protein [Lentisphaeraceae bacterium]|nr:RDD family protein [Lentisphaeraceae bacterium]
MEYYYLTANNQEQGPISEDNLIQLAQSGKINNSTPVRNTMVRTFKDAEKVPCLKGSLKGEVEFTDNKAEVANNLHRSASMIQPPKINYRLMAFFLDCLVIGLLIIVSYNLTSNLSSVLDSSHLNPFFLGTCVAIPILYYGITLGYKAQSFGFWFFGIMVIRGEGAPVLVGRAAFAAFFFLLTFPLAPVLIYIFNKGLHESFAGIRVVNVKMG